MRRFVFDAPAAAHLLGRLQFGVRLSDVHQAVRDGLDDTLDRLLSPQAESPEFEATSASLRKTALATGQIDDLKTWWLHRMLASANPTLEKLTLFWHNHFATSNAKVQSVAKMAAQNELLRKDALGPFPVLLNAIARDAAMLIYLDGQANRKRHPNENFAREVMELFCLGQGNYTEFDIQEAARALTGWQLRDDTFWWNDSQHDRGEKTIFGQRGHFQGADVLKLCTAQPACPRFLATKLLRTFVTSSPSTAQIDELARSYREHQLAAAPTLRDLCLQPAFFAVEARRSLIKSPVDFVLGTLGVLSTEIPLPAVVKLQADLGQDVFMPPSVKGWDGGRNWIQSTGWIQRWNFIDRFLSSAQYGRLQLDLNRQSPAETGEWAELVCPEVAQPLVWSDTSTARESLRTLLTAPEFQLM